MGKLDGLTKGKLVALYIEERKSLEDIGRLYRASRSAVYKKLKKLNIKQRSKSQARLEAQKQAKLPQQYVQINENFFGKWSAEMAYILGLLMTDGCLSRPKHGSYRISLCLNDKELLEKVAKAMGSEHTIALSRHQKGLYIFTFGREKLARDLMKIGMKPRKSLDIKFPDVPKEYLRDFIRGVFDGDGSITYRKFCIVSGSEKFAESLKAHLQRFLETEYVQLYRFESKVRKNPYYEVTVRRTAILIKLFHKLYDGMSDSEYLTRKKIKFEQVINKMLTKKLPKQ